MSLHAFLDSYEMTCCPTLRDEWIHLSELVTRKWHQARQNLEQAIVDDASDIVHAKAAEAHVRFRRLLMPFTTDAHDLHAKFNLPLLRDAILANSPDFVELILVDGRVNPGEWWSEKTRLIETALDLACREGHIEIARLLLADSRISLEHLHCVRDALKNGHIDVVRLLLADPRVNSIINIDALLQMACVHGCSELVRQLLEDPRANPLVSCSDQIFSDAASHGFIEIVRLLLASAKPSSSYRRMALQNAASKGYIEIVRLLYPHVNTEDRSLACNGACDNGHVEIVRILLADPHVHLEFKLDSAVGNWHIDVVRLLLNHFKDKDKVASHDTILVDAIHEIQIAIMRGKDFANMLAIVRVLLEDPHVNKSNTKKLRRAIRKVCCEQTNATSIELFQLFLQYGLVEAKATAKAKAKV